MTTTTTITRKIKHFKFGIFFYKGCKLAKSAKYFQREIEAHFRVLSHLKSVWWVPLMKLIIQKQLGTIFIFMIASFYWHQWQLSLERKTFWHFPRRTLFVFVLRKFWVANSLTLTTNRNKLFKNCWKIFELDFKAQNVFRFKEFIK